MKKLALFFYYIFVQYLPNSRMSMFLCKLRTLYVCKVLNIMIYDKNSRFQNKIYIGDGSNVSIGKNCQINENVFLQGAKIGDNCMIAPNVAILSSTHNIDRIDIPMNMQGEVKNQIVHVEDDVWIGRNAIVMPGVTLKKGSIIAAGAVVTKDVEAYDIVGGVPAKKIKSRLNV